MGSCVVVGGQEGTFTKDPGKKIDVSAKSTTPDSKG